VRGAQVYFSQFQRTPFGMLRLDPQVCPRRLPGACLSCADTSPPWLHVLL